MKKSRIVAFLASLALVFAGIRLMIWAWNGSFGGIVDIPTLLSFCLIAFPLIFFSGWAKDMLSAFKIVFSDEHADEVESQKASEACSFFCKILFLAAVPTALIGFVATLNSFDDSESLGTMISLALLPFVYAVIPSLFALTLKTMIDRKS